MVSHKCVRAVPRRRIAPVIARCSDLPVVRFGLDEVRFERAPGAQHVQCRSLGAQDERAETDHAGAGIDQEVTLAGCETAFGADEQG